MAQKRAPITIPATAPPEILVPPAFVWADTSEIHSDER